MKTIAISIGAMFITSVVALAQSTSANQAPVTTGTPSVNGANNNSVNPGANVNPGNSNYTNQATTPFTQPAQTLQGMPQSQFSPASTPAQPSPYQSVLPAQSPSTQTQAIPQPATPALPGSQFPTQPGTPAAGQPQLTQPIAPVQGVQPLPSTTTYPSIITNPASTPQTGGQQPDQPRKQ